MEGSIEGGEVRRCGLDGGLSSPAFWVERRRVLWRGSKEQAKGRTEWKAGVFVVPVRVLGEGGGLCLGQATATARWRPAGCSGRRGTAGEAPARNQGWWRSIRATCGRQRDAEHGWAGPPLRRRRLCTAAAGEKQRKELEVEERIILQFLKIPRTSL